MSSPSELWLFGSAARGDADEVSDVDVLVAGRLDLNALERLPYPRPRLSLVRYDWEELIQMASYGSLFLHHVRLEGRPLQPEYDSRLVPLLRTLPRYERAQYELASFHVVLSDVEHALADDHSPPFELAVIATALRHACILGSYAIGKPTFGRRSAFQVFLGHTGFGRMIDDVERLYDFRLYEDQRTAAPFHATSADVREWLTRARRVMTAVGRALDDIE